MKCRGSSRNNKAERGKVRSCTIAAERIFTLGRRVPQQRHKVHRLSCNRAAKRHLNKPGLLFRQRRESGPLLRLGPQNHRQTQLLRDISVRPSEELPQPHHRRESLEGEGPWRLMQCGSLRRWVPLQVCETV